jgi:hypothetical protein
MDGRPIILNGANIAWINYGWDLNTTNGDSSVCGMYDAMHLVSESGGNAIRLWLFEDAMTKCDGCEGLKSPFEVDEQGVPIGFKAGVLDRVQQYLDMAHSFGLLVVLVLWNGAYVASADDLTCQMFAHDALLSSVLANIVQPLAARFGAHPALGMWEVMNEPEAMVDFSVTSGEAACTADLGKLNTFREDGGGWTTVCLQPVTSMAAFLAKHIATLKAAGGRLVTSSSWCPSPLYGGINLWSDECLAAAGGEPVGFDVYQVHDYAKKMPSFAPNAYGTGWPGATPAADYDLDRPLFVGEISNTYGSGYPWQDASIPDYDESMATLAGQVVAHGYAGILSWEYTCNPPPAIADGVRAAAAASEFARTLPHGGTPQKPAACEATALLGSSATSAPNQHDHGPV